MVLKIRPYTYVFLAITLALFFNPLITIANPIPAPTIILYYEYMVFNITRINNDVANVSFYGKFVMENVGYKDLVLYFPVPNETLDNGHVTVIVNGKKVDYSFTWEFVVWGKKHYYITILGKLPLVKWIIKAEKMKKFSVEVLYDYKINVTNDTKTIYALGTGRYYYTYSKQVIADIYFHIKGFNDTLFRLSYADPFKKEEILIQATIINNTAYDKHVRLFSPMFSSFKEDLLIEFKPFNEEDYLLSNYFESIINIYINEGRDTLCIDGEANLSNWGTIIATLDSYVLNSNTIIVNISVLKTKAPSIQVIKKINYKNYVYLRNKMIQPYTIIFIVNGEKIDKVTIQPQTGYILLRNYLIKYYMSQTTTTTTTSTTPPTITSTSTTTTTLTTTTTFSTTITITTTTTTTTSTTTQQSTSTTISSTSTSARKTVPLNNTIVLGVLLLIIVLIIAIIIRKK